MKRFSLILLVGVLPSVVFQWSCREKSSLAIVGDSVDYNLHIRPILSDRCFKCHGPDANQRKANLRLDTPEGALAALKDDSTAHVIVPGSPDSSEVYLRISASDTSDIMPPVSSNLSLTADEVKLIRMWIAQGAVYKPHWAFIPPKKNALPDVSSNWPSNEIDYFTLTRMDAAGLKPNPEADFERLLKRLSFDITGLPPSIDLQDAYTRDFI
jgi:hypothetical protein